MLVLVTFVCCNLKKVRSGAYLILEGWGIPKRSKKLEACIWIVEVIVAESMSLFHQRKL